jgi:hypothetical protein
MCIDEINKLKLAVAPEDRNEMEEMQIQQLREQAIIKILEFGVRLCLKLQTSHIASIYFEKWVAKMRTLTVQSCWCSDAENHEDNTSWLEHIQGLSDRSLRCHIELITLSCLLLASKLNEQNQSQPTIRHLQRQVNDKFSYDDFVDQERWIICECLGWNGINVTTPYHVSDSI